MDVKMSSTVERVVWFSTVGVLLLLWATFLQGIARAWGV
jgi:hypothetical protein